MEGNRRVRATVVWQCSVTKVWLLFPEAALEDVCGDDEHHDDGDDPDDDGRDDDASQAGTEALRLIVVPDKVFSAAAATHDALAVIVEPRGLKQNI